MANHQQEFSVPSDYVVPENATTLDAPLRYRAESPDKTLFKRNTPQGWVTVSVKSWFDEVDAVAKGLIASGVQHGDRVALLSSTRYEWVLLDYAIWRTGATTVAIYETSSPDQVDWILSNSGTTLLFVETPQHEALHKSIIAATEVKETFVIDNGAIELLKKRGAEIADADLEARRTQMKATDAATLVYTSGTTGKPKGVVLSHANMLAECAAARNALGQIMIEGSSTLIFLPMAHVFARIISVASIESAIAVGHTSDLTNLIEDLAIFKPSYLLSVPRVFEKVYNSAKQKAYDGGKGKIFDRAVDVAIDYSKALETGSVGFALKAKHKLFDVLVYSKLRAALGGNCDSAISGGAPLGARLGHFYRGIGIPIFEGYGLSETTAAVTVNRQGEHRVGSVGRPVPGQSVAIAEDGEILLKGPVVFSGYYKNPEATADALRDGWFHTGDIGKLDDGYLFITGRKKELIVTAGGKNVSPSQLEDTIRAHPLVSQCLVVGDNQPYIAALVTIDPEALPGWLERHSLPVSTTITEAAVNPDLHKEIEAAINAANATVSNAEAIKKFTIIDTDFTMESGELTPTMKLKRNVIHEAHAAEIAGLYS